MMPPCIVAPFGFWCFFTTLTPAVEVTITFSRSGCTWVIVPRLPMSLPDSTTTPSTRAAEHLDAQHLARAGVVGDTKAGLLLNHDYRALSRTSTTRQRLSFDNGRVSVRRTRSPSRTSLVGSCA